MKRPVDITELLDSKSASRPSLNVVKPTFLSKKRRTEAASLLESSPSSKQEPESLKQLKWRKNGSVSTSETETLRKTHSDFKSRSSERNHRGKFQFDWKPEEDTMNGDMPIVNSKATELRKRVPKSTEEVYMGKHWGQKSLKDMTERDWRILREDFHIETKGGTIQHPLRNWSETGLIPEEIVEIIQRKLNYLDPSPIQRITIPNAVKGRDFLGVAATGSGKTLAFLIPSLCQLNELPPMNDVTKLDGPLVLVLAPTRELAQQIEAEANKVLRHWTRPTEVASIVGGHSVEEIAFALKDGCDILVATPGRLIDCLESHMLVLKQVRTLVLDEADRMIDLGFESQLTTILSRVETGRKRQTMMFTATMSSSVERIANGYLNKPAYVRVGSQDTNSQVKQVIDYIPSEEQRFIKLSRAILPAFRAPIMIFINYKRTADWLATKFASETKYRVTTLHGSKSQEQREFSLNLLRTGKADIMIATDVAGRGIDIPNVSLVVNFQMSTSFENYVHRIGRTGRAGKSGTSVTFLGDHEDEKVIDELCKYVRRTDREKINEIKLSVRQKFKLEQNQLKPILF
ncbi:LANO_0E10528g1_1 [Lachancea nothofagi CBS 11611]|uniref:RNA helicase n=1 Tax=Lachancea nothofagi CBS 11611 TaxID=1266666 RepID=A0A1G4JWU9_9SACH|nr:LANO_0E10528g1_1 [Lachancea nothofagi CBS 11611]